MTSKRRYTYSTGESFEADLEDLEKLLADNRLYLDNYLELQGSLYDDVKTTNLTTSIDYGKPNCYLSDQ